MTSHAHRGREWQLVLDGWHDRYRLEGRAVVLHTPPPVKVLSRVGEGGTFRACFLGLGPPDYAALVADEGRGVPLAIAFDAKDCSGSRWPFDDLPEHQAQDLEDWARIGGVAFVALRIGGRGWVLPWAVLGPLWRTWWERTERAPGGSASLSVGDLEGWACPMPRPGDWLEALP